MEILVPVLIVLIVAMSLSTGRRGGGIAHHPYADQYNDASGARDR